MKSYLRTILAVLLLACCASAAHGQVGGGVAFFPSTQASQVGALPASGGTLTGPLAITNGNYVAGPSQAGPSVTQVPLSIRPPVNDSRGNFEAFLETSQNATPATGTYDQGLFIGRNVSGGNAYSRYGMAMEYNYARTDLGLTQYTGTGGVPYGLTHEWYTFFTPEGGGNQIRPMMTVMATDGTYVSNSFAATYTQFGDLNNVHWRYNSAAVPNTNPTVRYRGNRWLESVTTDGTKPGIYGFGTIIADSYCFNSTADLDNDAFFDRYELRQKLAAGDTHTRYQSISNGTFTWCWQVGSTAFGSSQEKRAYLTSGEGGSALENFGLLRLSVANNEPALTVRPVGDNGTGLTTTGQSTLRACSGGANQTGNIFETATTTVNNLNGTTGANYATDYAVRTRIDKAGRAMLYGPASVPADADLNNSEVTFSVDETNGQLKIKVKYSNGTVKTASVTLNALTPKTAARLGLPAWAIDAQFGMRRAA
jgi:hypothetical protein